MKKRQIVSAVSRWVSIPFLTGGSVTLKPPVCVVDEGRGETGQAAAGGTM